MNEPKVNAITGLPEKPSEKIVSLSDAVAFARAAQAAGRTVVFANGCFDILHAGHVSYLNDARAEGEVCEALAGHVGCDPEQVNVKATTTEELGFCVLGSASPPQILATSQTCRAAGRLRPPFPARSVSSRPSPRHLANTAGFLFEWGRTASLLWGGEPSPSGGAPSPRGWTGAQARRSRPSAIAEYLRNGSGASVRT